MVDERPHARFTALRRAVERVHDDGLRVPCGEHLPGFDKLAPQPEVVAAIKGEFVKAVPLGRMASPGEIARWIVHVADPASSWMTGAILAIDGGMSLT